MDQRPVRSIPRAVLALLAAGIALQLCVRWANPASMSIEDVPPAPSTELAQLLAIGEPVAMARLMTLYAQSFDAQAGYTVSHRRLDYSRLSDWLDRPLTLDPAGQYPLMVASRVYAEVKDADRQRLMLEFVYRKFLDDPDRRWTWLAHAAVVARHQLNDIALAQRYAHAIREHATGKQVPQWARQMEIFILEDMDELQRAKILLGGLLESGEITDPHEVLFLKQRLEAMEKKSRSTP